MRLIRLRVLVVVAIVALVGVSMTAWANHTTNVRNYTGCLTTATGVITRVKLGNVPLVAAKCPSGQTLIHLSGGDITSVLAAPDGGLTGGATNGAAALSIDFASLDGRYVDEGQGDSVTGAMVADASLGKGELSAALQDQLLSTVEVMRTLRSCPELGINQTYTSQDLRFCTYAGTNLAYSDFLSIDLRYADLRNANLTSVIFHGTNLLGVDMTDAEVFGVIFLEVTCPDGTWSESVGSTCEGHLTP